jgi:spoIIIJ-associated protein
MEFEGKSLDEALARAAAETGRKAGDLRYEVIEEAKRGFLGMGGRQVRIRLIDAGPQGAVRSVPGAGSSDVTGGRAGAGRSRIAGESAADKDHAAVRAAAERIIDEMGVDVTMRLRDRDEAIVLEIGGPDAKLFLENDGEAIEGLQHILNRILMRDEPLGPRVVVDCAGFRNRRDEETIERARQAATTALRTSKPVHIEGLNAYERRLVHITLAEDKKVRTFSTGEGAIKRLTIEPAGREPAAGKA